MTCGIYAIFSSFDDECLYVGQSKNVEDRYRQHITKLKSRRKSALASFVAWYHDNGADESLLRFELLETCQNIDLVKNDAEARWFDKLKPRFYGKMPSLSEKWEHTETTKQAIREAMLAKSLLIKLMCPICESTFRQTKAGQKVCSRKCSDELRSQNAIKRFASKEELEILFVEKNLSIFQIAEIVGTSDRTISRLLTVHGLRTPIDGKQFSHALLKTTPEELKALYWDEDLSLSQIGKRLDLSGKTISKLFDHWSITKRSTSETVSLSKKSKPL